MDRRQFLRAGAMAGAVAAGRASAAQISSRSPRIRRQVTLGRTGLRVSDISFGGSSLSDPALVRHAYERGVTYFDTAESYRWGSSEEAVGEALAGRARQGGHRVQDQGRRRRRPTRHDGGPGGQPAAPAHGLRGHLLQPRGQRRGSHAQRRVGRVHGAREATGQDPLPRHVRPRQPPGGCAGLCARQRSGGRDPHRLQLRPGPGFLRSAAPHLPLRGPAAGAAAGAGAGRAQKAWAWWP